MHPRGIVFQAVYRDLALAWDLKWLRPHHEDVKETWGVVPPTILDPAPPQLAPLRSFPHLDFCLHTSKTSHMKQKAYDSFWWLPDPGFWSRPVSGILNLDLGLCPKQFHGKGCHSGVRARARCCWDL